MTPRHRCPSVHVGTSTSCVQREIPVSRGKSPQRAAMDSGALRKLDAQPVEIPKQQGEDPLARA